MKKFFPILLIALAVTLSGCALPGQKPAPVACTMEAKICPDGSSVGRQGPNCEFAECPAQIANPASVNCKEKGGSSVIKTKPDGSQYALCYFDDNRACEEWAMMRGDCPVGRQGPNCEFAACPGGQNQIANPASVNCKNKGGTSVIKTKPDGSQYALCYFDDNRACEEWAMMRGDCPVGGVKTTGYNTEAQSFCAWSGGSTYAVENAVCTFKDGSQCSDEAFYTGACQKGQNKTSQNTAWKTYTNTKYGFQFQYPADAKIGHTEDINGIEIELNIPKNNFFTIRAVTKTWNNGILWSADCNDFGSGITNSYKRIDGISFIKGDVSGGWSSMNSKFSATEYCVLRNGVAYKLIPQVPSGSNVDNNSTLNRIISTFKFTK